MKNIFVKVPKELHIEFKTACAKLNIKMRDPILKVIDEVIKEAKDVKKK